MKKLSIALAAAPLVVASGAFAADQRNNASNTRVKAIQALHRAPNSNLLDAGSASNEAAIVHRLSRPTQISA